MLGALDPERSIILDGPPRRVVVILGCSVRSRVDDSNRMMTTNRIPSERLVE